MRCRPTPCRRAPALASARCGRSRWVGDAGFLDSIVARWRNATASAANAVQGAALFAESVNLPPNAAHTRLPAPPGLEDRRSSARDAAGERGEFGAVRAARCMLPTQAATPVRAIREKLHHR